MTKEEIALQLTIEFSKCLAIDHENPGKSVADFYNTIYDNVKTERSVRHGDVNVLK